MPKCCPHSRNQGTGVQHVLVVINEYDFSLSQMNRAKISSVITNLKNVSD